MKNESENTMKSNTFYGTDALQQLRNVLVECEKNKQKIVFLSDTHTNKYCVPVLMEMLEQSASNFHQIIIPAGEAHKTLDSVANIWQQLTAIGAGRDAFLINLGGGMVTDIGGFAASCFKRGIRTIHIPTSLLAMVDAAIGGKTGIDFQYFKNHIGTFYPSEMVLIFNEFLSTLPERELLSGFAEVLKYGFISDKQLLDADPQQFTTSPALTLIRQCVDIKKAITTLDPTEKAQRKILNFGHTIGHALESYALENEISLLHGEAIAAGMLAELYLSHRLLQLPLQVAENLSTTYKKFYKPYKFSENDITNLIERMFQDKKNNSNKLLFVLITSIGQAVYDQEVSIDLVRESLHYYLYIVE